MLQDLRDKAQGWISWVIIGLVGITFVLVGTGSVFTGNDRGQTVAKVNGSKITVLDVEQAYQRFIRQPGAQALRNLDPHTIKANLVETLIEQTILLQTAKKLGMRIDDHQIQHTISTIPALNENGRFSEEAYRHLLNSTGFTHSEFQQFLRDTLLREQLQQGIIQTSFAISPDVKDLVKFNQQKRNFRLLKIERHPFEKESVVTAEEMDNYYKSHLEHFTTTEQVSIEYLHLSLQDLMKNFTPNENELKDFYEANKVLFAEPERIHAAHILIALPKNADKEQENQALVKIKEVQAQLKAGQSFAELAKKYSDDKGSAETGGDLEWFSRQEMVPEFEKASFALQTVGEVSEPVRTDFGYHLIKLLGREKENIHPFEKIKDQVAAQMKQHKAQEQFTEDADQLAALVYDHPNSLQAAQDKLKLKSGKSALFTKERGPKEEILQHPEIIAAAFNPSVKDDKNNSDIIKIDNENYLVLRIAEYLPAKQIPFNEAKDEINAQLLTQKSEELAKKKAEEILVALKKEKDEAQLLAKYQWQDKHEVTRGSKDLDHALINAAFSLDPALNNEPKLKMTKLANGDYAVVWLTKVDNGNFETLSPAEQDKYLTVLSSYYGELEFTLFALQMMKTAKIERYLDKI